MVDATDATPMIAREGLPVFKVAGTTWRIFVRGLPVFLMLGLLSSIPSAVRLAVFKPAPETLFTVSALVTGGVRTIALCFLQIPMTYVAVRLFEGEDYALADAFGLALRRFLPVLGAAILYLLAFYGGMILLVVPGVIFACMFAVVVPVAALEQRGPVAAMRCAGELTRFNRWRLMGISLVFFVPVMIVGGLLGVLSGLRGYVLLGQWLGIAIQAVWAPLAGVLTAAIYVALRRLKDGGGFGVASVFD